MYLVPYLATSLLYFYFINLSSTILALLVELGLITILIALSILLEITFSNLTTHSDILYYA